MVQETILLCWRQSHVKCQMLVPGSSSPEKSLLKHKKITCWLTQTARSEGISLSALTAEALEYYLKQKRKKAAGNRLLKLIQPGSMTPDAWVELEKGRTDDRA